MSKSPLLILFIHFKSFLLCTASGTRHLALPNLGLTSLAIGGEDSFHEARGKLMHQVVELRVSGIEGTDQAAPMTKLGPKAVHAASTARVAVSTAQKPVRAAAVGDSE